MSRKLRVFLCHATEDRPATRELYKKLAAESWIQPWMDIEDLLPGQEFDFEIHKALHEADVILICMSQTSVSKSGYLNKEIRRALDAADEKPEGSIYIIPVKFDECVSSFEKLNKYQWVNYYETGAHERLIKSLRMRAKVLRLRTSNKKIISTTPRSIEDVDLDLYRFIEISLQKDSKITYPFWIGKYPVTNAQYKRFLKASDFANPVYWLEFPKFNKNCQLIGNWGKEGLDWLYEGLEEEDDILVPSCWDDQDLGKSNPNHPVVGISWYEANAYAEWMFRNWEKLEECKANPELNPECIRLPLDIEWTISAGGKIPKRRFAWDEAGKVTTLLKEIIQRANILDSGIGHTTPVNKYPLGKSPYGVMDMSGNVSEWQANYSADEFDGQKALSLRGGSWNDDDARVAVQYCWMPNLYNNDVGFRLCVLPGKTP